ncbi:uncharacterized protein K452DRAFT_85213 [Aplosporella prunicola CBS 121167]|uniref:Uncharacterized protein n=1 Tax=Aplosporella prunicola CBS 121167 TaxID=1176127 RepID=A0A6A6B3Q8_9PEZI|nr:uncharacterized protein K452DRAFT_85213 [Aplosporella prunicola CBS 121167]KAF2138849.1 hypothetical protein K452DRAFT_85213 [Aplosporella prunicola CBS 121167]
MVVGKTLVVPRELSLIIIVLIFSALSLFRPRLRPVRLFQTSAPCRKQVARTTARTGNERTHSILCRCYSNNLSKTTPNPTGHHRRGAGRLPGSKAQAPQVPHPTHRRQKRARMLQHGGARRSLRTSVLRRVK